MKKDRARTKTDKRLNKIKNEIDSVYETSPDILSVKKRYMKYMASVKKKTEDAYNAYINEEDRDVKADKKKEYEKKVRRYTIESKEYKVLIKTIASTLAKVNQQALDISNDSMLETYVENYNQVAIDCKKAGIKVDG